MEIYKFINSMKNFVLIVNNLSLIFFFFFLTKNINPRLFVVPTIWRKYRKSLRYRIIEY